MLFVSVPAEVRAQVGVLPEFQCWLLPLMTGEAMASRPGETADAELRRDEVRSEYPYRKSCKLCRNRTKKRANWDKQTAGKKRGGDVRTGPR